MKKAVFLDRDGVLNYERGDYSYLPDHFQILPWVPDMLRFFKSKGYITIVITNQGGISKGLFKHAHVQQVHAILQREAEKVHAPFTEIFYCPHHANQTKCLCRKPGFLLFERAIARHGIDAQASFMIGDSMRDVLAARKAGIHGILIPTNTNPLDYTTIRMHF